MTQPRPLADLREPRPGGGPVREPMKVQVNFGGRPTTLEGVREIIIDGCRFDPQSLLGLARSNGELFCAERTGDTVTVHRITATVGSEPARLVVQKRPKK